MDLSLNEAETLAAKAARGAGFPWGLADEIGRAARVLAMQREDWGEALLALVSAAQSFEAPAPERVERWRRGGSDMPGSQPLCPVRTAALLLDDAIELDSRALQIARVGQPIWLAAMLTRPSDWIVDFDEPLGDGDVTLRRGVAAVRPLGVRRAAITLQTLTALNGYAARTYVPESERSRKRGAGGGTVDDD